MKTELLFWLLLYQFFSMISVYGSFKLILSVLKNKCIAIKCNSIQFKLIFPDKLDLRIIYLAPISLYL